jgi:anti-sigma B factor antagonist
MTHPTPLSMQLDSCDGATVVVLDGEIDAFTAPGLLESIEHACEPGAPVVLHMERVTFIDSSGIRALLTAAGTVQGHPRSVQIHSASDQVRRVLAITGLEKLFLLGH